MTTAKQLAKYFANNTVSNEEIEQRLNNYRTQIFCEGIKSMHNYLIYIKKKRKSLQSQRLKKEWDEFLSSIRDMATKKK